MARFLALLVLVTSVAIGLWHYGYIGGIVGQSSSTVPALAPKQQLQHQIPIEQLEQRVASSKPIYKRVAVGYNTNSDLIVPGLQLLHTLNINANSIKPADYEKLTTMDEFVASFSHFFALGSAAERFIEDENLCRQIIDTAQHLRDDNLRRPKPESHRYVGGNAALMAVTFTKASQQLEALLAGSPPEDLKALLPSGVKLLPNAPEPTIGEVHLIMEFPKGAKLGQVESTRANRFITHCDFTNSRILPLEPFHDAMKQFNVDLLVLSGLHLLERESAEFQDQRLAEIRDRLQLGVLEPSIPAHLELASVASTNFMEKVGRKMVPFVDSIGLNEQELGHLYFALGGDKGRGITSEDPERISKAASYMRNTFKDPAVWKSVEAIKYVFKIANAENERFPSQRRLSRVHFHSLKFHIVAQKLGSGWDEGKAAVAAGSVVATKQACGYESNIDYSRVDFPWEMEYKAWALPEPYNPREPVLHVRDASMRLEYFIAPVAVCINPGKTVGLGDAISASGLLHHRFKRE